MKRAPLADQISRSTQRSSTASAPSPTGGWNTRDPLAGMSSTDAVILNNWWPSPGLVETRLGAQDYATGFNSRVKTLMSYAGATADSNKLIAACDYGLFDVTFGGAVGLNGLPLYRMGLYLPSTIGLIPSERSSAWYRIADTDYFGDASLDVTDGYFQYINFNNAAGSYIEAVNGVDKLKLFDGTNWFSIDETTSPGVIGVDTTTLVGINTFKRRIWFVQEFSMSAWYLPVESLGGTATEFPLGHYFSKGGYLMAMGTWTLDSGEGVDDYAVFVSSEGQVAVFQGTDPDSATTFSLVGIYFIGAPIGRRCLLKYGGDLLYISAQGLYPLSKALTSASIDRTEALSSKIDPTFTESAGLYGSNLGWQTVHFPPADMILVNIPTSVGATSEQYAMNTINGSWCRFTGWLSSCYEVFQGRLFFGGETTVVEAWTGTSDFGNNIVASAQTAYSYLNANVQSKHFKMVRPILSTEKFKVFTMHLAIEVDFTDSIETSQVQLGTNSVSNWDTDQFDLAVWSAGREVLKDWYTCAAPDGYAASLEIRISGKETQVGWTSTDFTYIQGGIL